jgi:hypothetical protein
MELLALLASLRKVLDRLEHLRTGPSVLAGLADQPASPEAFAALDSRLQNVERVLARRLRSGRGRPWRSPKRTPRAKGRDQLAIAVEQRAGLTARQAKKAVTGFWNVITQAIRCGEVVETPASSDQNAAFFTGARANSGAAFCAISRASTIWPEFRTAFRASSYVLTN